jgi:thiol-disulfide isomerase/thioredoxin
MMLSVLKSVQTWCVAPRVAATALAVIAGLGLGGALLTTGSSPALALSVPREFKPTKQSPLLPSPFTNECKWTVLYFYSPSCSACKAVKPVIREMETKLGGKVQFVWIDVSQSVNAKMSELYHITFTPSYMVYSPLGRPTLDMTRDLDHQLLQSYLYDIKRTSIQPSC